MNIGQVVVTPNMALYRGVLGLSLLDARQPFFRVAETVAFRTEPPVAGVDDATPTRESITDARNNSCRFFMPESPSQYWPLQCP